MTDNKLFYQDAIVDTTVLNRFPRRLTTFGRHTTDSSASFYNQSQDTSALDKVKAGETGYTRLEAAMKTAAWTVAEHFRGAYSDQPLGQPHFMLEALGQYEVNDPAAMSQHIKTAARLFGAVLTGISTFDPRWVYQFDHQDAKLDISRDMKTTIVMAVSMDAQMILEAPKLIASVATGVGYSKMAAVASSMAQFIRHLGYKAIAMGNDTALSIPIAIDAGLGQMGRNGLLITKEFGPCIRLCKVFTDMPLVTDKPAEQGLLHSCKQCHRCASACPGHAISFEVEPSYSVTCSSNNPGIKRWAVNVDKCYSFWMENGSGCSSCIAACPYTQMALKKQNSQE